MPRTFALAILLALSVLAPAAHATPITGYAIGTIEEAYVYGAPPDRPYAFAVGETVYLAFTYDADPRFRYPPVWVDAATPGGGGFHFSPFDVGDGQGMTRVVDGVLVGLSTT